MGIVKMSHQEIDRLLVIQACTNKQLSQANAGIQLGLSLRQIKRLVRSYREDGAEGLISKRRGKPSNHQLPLEVKRQALEIIEREYVDFGPTLIHEKLIEEHGLILSVESVRQLMINAGIWQAKARHQARIHQSRERRACAGELVQIDGSPHDWFEERGERCTLLVFIDDATSRLVALHFAESETTQAYMTATREYIEREGRPVAFYSDKYGVFRMNIKGKEDELTQFGRAMKSLDIELICANTPQAKGRVERANQTLQDRLVKEMRLAGISTIEQANEFAKTYIEKHNARFAVTPRNSHNAHRPLLHTQDELDVIFSLHDTRKLSKNLTFKYQHREYQLQGYGQGYRLRHKIVTVSQTFDGRITILLDGKPLGYRVLAVNEEPTPIIEAKSLHQHINLAQKQQNRRVQWKPPLDHPWKRGYPDRNSPPA